MTNHTYYTVEDNLPQRDFYYDKGMNYRRFTPSTFNPIRHKKQSTDREDLRGKLCPSCGITRSMTNKCECNS